MTSFYFQNKKRGAAMEWETDKHPDSLMGYMREHY